MPVFLTTFCFCQHDLFFVRAGGGGGGRRTGEGLAKQLIIFATIALKSDLVNARGFHVGFNITVIASR